MRRACAVTLLPVFLSGLVVADIPAATDQPLHYEAQLHKDLLCSYNCDHRPVKNHTSTVTVRVRFMINYYKFDASEDVLNVHSFLSLYWKDEFLHWDPKDYGGLTDIIIDSHEIWNPRLVLYNADVTMSTSDQLNTRCIVDYSGNITCVPQSANYAICHTSLRRWPYDTQNCTLNFGSWVHKGEQINFVFYEPHPVDISELRNGPGWKLLRVDHERLVGNYSCCPNDTYPTLKYTFVMKREAAGPAAIVVVPSIVVVIITLTSILLDVKDNVRLALVSFNLMCHFMHLTEIAYNIPRHGADTPILMLFVRDSMLLTVTALLVTLLLMSITRRDDPVPRWIIMIKQLVNRGPGKYLIFMEFDPSDNAKTKLTDDDGNASEEIKRPANEWMQFANLLNSITFIVMFLVYFILICAYIPYDD